jgi:hypothetical protein
VRDRSARDRSFRICLVILRLSLLCFIAAFILALAGKVSALAFTGSGLVLALWASVVASPSGVAARDIVDLIRQAKFRRRPP